MRPPSDFVGPPTIKMPCPKLQQLGVVVGVSLPPKMVSKLEFEILSMRPGAVHVMASFEGNSVLMFELLLEELLALQTSQQMVRDCGKVKMHVTRTLEFFNER